MKRENLTHTLHSHLYAVFKICTAECITTAGPLNEAERSCLMQCYSKANNAHHSHLHSLLL